MMYNFIKTIAYPDKAEVAKAIGDIESKYGIVFPAKYREYAICYDRSLVTPVSLNVNGYICEVAKIIPLCGDGLTFEKIVENDRDDGIISNSLYPIAANRGGDIYYWDCSLGAVYLLLSDDIENPFKISNSVEEFFALLK